MKNKPNLTYDPNLKPFYVSKAKVNNKQVQLFDLDVHCNNLILVKRSHLTEYYNEKFENIIIPKTFAENLHLTNDNIIDLYMKTQAAAREKIEKQAIYVSVITFIYVIVAVASIFNFIDINLAVIAVFFGLFYVYFHFIRKSIEIAKGHKNFIYALTKKYSSEEIVNNINNIIAYTNEINYMTLKQKTRTVKHFSKLQEIAKNS